MELLSGETLRAHLLRVGRVPCQQAATLLAEMAAGLSAAHGAGVVHADFKSENIMLVPEPGGVRPVIMDFGLARPLETTSRLSRSGKKLVAGTVGYMAPEQLDGRRASEASDVYALGVVFFEMLTGRLPFAGATALAAAVEAITLAPPSVRAHGVEAPPAFDAVVARCLQVDPGQRFASAAQVIPALHAPSPQSPRRGRPPTAAVAIAAVLAMVGAIGAVAWWSHARRPERTQRPPVAAVPLAPPPPPAPAPPAPLPLPAAPSPSQPATAVAAPSQPAHKRPARTRRVPEAAPPAATDPLLGERL
jgi:serine/threonine protein kinase